MPGHVQLSLETSTATTPLIALLRRHTNRPISDLRRAIMNRLPFLDERPHHNQYPEFITRVAALLDALEAEGVRYLVKIDGEPQSAQSLRNVFRRWRDIDEQTRRMADLESGEPCIETLEWLKRESPADVYRRTIRQIVDRDGFACDEETVAWARRELEAAEPGAASGRFRTHDDQTG